MNPMEFVKEIQNPKDFVMNINKANNWKDDGGGYHHAHIAKIKAKRKQNKYWNIAEEVLVGDVFYWQNFDFLHFWWLFLYRINKAKYAQQNHYRN